jgi:hypothetical protein
MNKKETQEYVNETIHNKLYSKIHYHEFELMHYFKNRHKGLVGIDSEQTTDVAKGCVRNLRVWREIQELITTQKQLK